MDRFMLTFRVQGNCYIPRKKASSNQLLTCSKTPSDFVVAAISYFTLHQSDFRLTENETLLIKVSVSKTEH